MLAWLWLAPSIGSCGSSTSSVIVEEELQSKVDALLSGCTDVTVAALQAVAVGAAGLLPGLASRYATCIEMSEHLMEEAFKDGPLCKSCPAACMLALLLQAVSLEAKDTAQCSQTLLLLIRAYGFLGGLEPTWLPTNVDAILVDLVDRRRAQCAALRHSELQRISLPGGGDSSGSASFESLRKPVAVEPAVGRLGRVAFPHIAVLIAAAPSMLRVYQPFINLWRCYAVRHGLGFVLDTDMTDVTWPHQRAATWMRWFAARRHLKFYGALLVVDLDQFVAPECWNVSIPGVLGAWAGAFGGGSAPDVGTRDFARPQTSNNGVVLVRSSPRGLFFVEQLLAKAAWMQTIERDQGAFDETVLEVLGLEAAARGEEGYASECAQHVFANARGDHEVALYARCWWRISERLAGPFGARRSGAILFADPRVADVNHVLGARGLAEPAVLQHFAGRSQDWAAMLEAFGLERRHTGDCRRVFQHVDAAAAGRACVPGRPAVEECEARSGELRGGARP